MLPTDVDAAKATAAKAGAAPPRKGGRKPKSTLSAYAKEFKPNVKAVNGP